MQITVLFIFAFVYIGMFLGEIPGLRLDRTGIALIGAILVLWGGILTPEEAWEAVDVPTIALLFGLMVVSSQFRLGGFYVATTRRLATLPLSPKWLLLVLTWVAGTLSALLANDIICLAMTPVLVEGCAHRKLNPIPFLLALACASNIGSAATLIGNPQNMLVGQRLQLSFSGYLLDGLVPAAVGLLIAWAVIGWIYRGQWYRDFTISRVEENPTFNAWQTTKGIVILTVLLIAFLFLPIPREIVALTAAGVLLASRKMASRQMLGLVDWQILVLFVGLFIVNRSLETSGLLEVGMNGIAATGVDLQHPGWLFSITVLLSNLVSNVPAVMLLLPTATHPLAGSILALSSTLAGNLILVGSIANLIVVDKAAQMGISLGWKEHARVGVPVTVLTLITAAGWLILRGL
jgi:Na+/H+ antiporter NhaD/arsenite permease-like protein